ncbi:hypothetical protein ACTJIL_08810 [Luteimonas sp. 22616]|uniref:hypothetical protein n=1 Tax=Luteimonas sp. 22616 TaxID=3453951 RepID=UPI003F8638F2
MSRRLPDEADQPAAPAPPSLLRRCALGIWLCGIALLGVVEFRRYALAGEDLSMTPVAWMWLVGSTVTGVVGVVLLLRELRRNRQP